LHLHVPAKKQIDDVCKTFRPAFNGLIIANNGFNAETGLSKLRSKNCDAISFAKLYITNPDLAERIAVAAPIDSKLDFGTLYGSQLADKSKGYTDYEPYKKH
jgi:N-ethylmaleimide reductase